MDRNSPDDWRLSLLAIVVIVAGMLTWVLLMSGWFR